MNDTHFEGCPDCCETGGTLEVVTSDNVVTYWHPECWEEFNRWLQNRDPVYSSDVQQLKNMMAKKFVK